MSRVTQATKVGVFVALSAAGMWLIWRTVSKEVGGGSGYVVHGYFDDAMGVANHSRVTVAGIPIGSIQSIRLENGKARIDIKVSNDVPLYKDATVTKKSSSLLGEYVLTVADGTHGTTTLKDGDEIIVLPEKGSIDQIKADIQDVVASLKPVAQQLALSVGTQQGGENIKAILKNLADATDALNGTIRENRAFINDAIKNIDAITKNGQPEIAEILQNIREITKEIKEIVAKTTPNGDNQIGDTLDHLNTTSKSLESAVSHIDSVAGRIDRGEGTIGKLTKDETLINETTNVVEGVGDLIGPISRLQTIVGLRSDYNFLANTLKSYVEIRLQPREDKYYSIELINDPRGKTTITQTDVDTTNPNDPAHYRTVTTTTTDAFRFSLQFARRLGPFTGRFGVKESTGGVGLDIHLLNDRFEIVQDLFGFAEEITPRYRVFVSYQFINRLWLLGGIDHVFLQNRRDYFIGLALRFNDEDLKTILPFAPVGAAAR